MAEIGSTSNPTPTKTHPERALNAVVRVTASDVRGSKHLLLPRWCEQRRAPGLAACVCLFVAQAQQQRWDLSGDQPEDQMDGEPAYQSAAQGKRVCSREERKRRKSSGMEEGPSGQQGRRGSSSVSSASHGISFWIVDNGEGGGVWISQSRGCLRSFVYMLLCDVTVDDLCPAVLWPHWLDFFLGVYAARGALKELSLPVFNHAFRWPQLRHQRPGRGRPPDLSGAADADAGGWNPAAEDGPGRCAEKA